MRVCGRELPLSGAFLHQQRNFPIFAPANPAAIHPFSCFMSSAPTPDEFSPAVLEQLRRLQARYTPDGQDLAAYLEGLYHAKYINYWDYIELDTLLSIQRPLTNIPDERIFIMYHQISELYFKLCLCEYEQIGDLAAPTLGEVVLRLGRINRYFDNLIDSFDVMVDGLDKQQFLDFRMALMPASGFQSVQYRMIEIASTALENLTDEVRRQALGEASAHDYDQLLGCIYWKAGATVEASGAKALTLLEFERKYTADLVRHAAAYHERNVWAVVQRLPAADREHPRLLRAMRQLDVSANVNWPLMHFKSAVRYLQQHPADVAATGGTNWRSTYRPSFSGAFSTPNSGARRSLPTGARAGWSRCLATRPPLPELFVRGPQPRAGPAVPLGTRRQSALPAMTAEEQKIIDTSLEQLRTLHQNISTMWDSDTRATFYYGVLSGAVARNGAAVAQALTAMLTEVYTNTARSHVDLGKLANGFAGGPGAGPAAEPAA